GFIDVLYGFPTIGYAKTSALDFVLSIPQTLQNIPATSNLPNFAFVAFGQIGQPAQITYLRILGVLQRVRVPGPGTDGVGSVVIKFFDGVDSSDANKPTDAKLAKNINGGDASYIFRFTAASPANFDNHDFSFDGGNTPPIKITDPNGRFGFVI